MALRFILSGADREHKVPNATLSTYNQPIFLCTIKYLLPLSPPLRFSYMPLGPSCFLRHPSLIMLDYMYLKDINLFPFTELW